MAKRTEKYKAEELQQKFEEATQNLQEMASVNFGLLRRTKELEKQCTQTDTQKYGYTSGATRSDASPNYFQIPGSALRRLAKRYQIGAETHGLYNYHKGVEDPEFIRDVFNHVIAHLYEEMDILTGRKEPTYDDNFAAALWGICTLIEFDEQNNIEPHFTSQVFQKLRSED